MPYFVKQPVDEQRIRRMPRQFGAVDRELVYRGIIRKLSIEEMALYLILVCVSDVEGLSYYSDQRLATLLGIDTGLVKRARAGLLAKGMILYKPPLYQLLNLPEAS